LRKKKHPVLPLSHILAYPMAANMAGSGAQERVRVSAIQVRGKRRACAIAGGLPCRRTRRSSMSEYRSGVTSPHPLPLRAFPLSPPLSFLFNSYSISALLTRLSLFLYPFLPPSYALEHSYYLATYLQLQRGAPPLSSIPSPSHSSCVPTRFLSVALAASFHVILFSHYPESSCLPCPSGPLSSPLSSHRPTSENGTS